jgi:hypothetical protein
MSRDGICERAEDGVGFRIGANRFRIGANQCRIGANKCRIAKNKCRIARSQPGQCL